MPDEDDRFSDVAEQLKQTEGERGSDDDSTDTEDKSQSVEEIATEDTGAETESAPEQDEENEDDSADGPAFSFDETDMHGFYVREETWDGVTRMRSSVTAVCSMFDVPEFEGREFQDACLQVIADHGDEIALQILRERGIEPDEDRVREVVDMLDEQVSSE